MASGIFKTCGSSGADYDDFVTAIYEMVNSGVVATGEIDYFYLTVLDGQYTGVFNVGVPYSGEFNIAGSGVHFSPYGQCSVTGNFNWSNFYIDGSGLSSWFLYEPSGSEYNLTDLTFLNVASGINADIESYLTIESCRAIGDSEGTFIQSESGAVYVSDSNITNYDKGFKINNLNMSNCRLYDNNISIQIESGGYCGVQTTLLYSNVTGIYINQGYLNASRITNKATLPVSCTDGYYFISESILQSPTYCITGSVITGCYSSYCNMYVSGVNVSGPSPESSGNFSTSPSFNNTTYGDFRLKFHPSVGSVGISGGAEKFGKDVTVYTNQSKLIIYDKKGPSTNYFDNFIYKQGSNLLFSDFGKEVTFSEKYSTIDYNKLEYNYGFTTKFSSSGVRTYGGPTETPWDYDVVKFISTRINEDEELIVYRSAINIKTLLDSELGLTYKDLLPNISKASVKCFNKIEYRGITYDYDLTQPGQNIVWIVEGYNQMLIKRNSFTGEILEKYPLLSMSSEDARFGRPSGLVYIGPEGDRYKYVFQNNINKYVYGSNENGDFKFFNNQINNNYDIRGILSYKNRLYLTGTKHHSPLSDHSKVYTNVGGDGVVLVYDNNLNWDHYSYKTDNGDGPKEIILTSGNFYPTDITVYEDGNMFIADYNVSGFLYKYKPAYDYALKRVYTDKNALVILREEYEDVDI